MEKLLTVTIPSYNVEKYLPETLPTFLDESILEKIEILIVNDGSKDNTQEIEEQFRAQYPDTIRVINKENGGHGSTINTGIECATGKYFRVVDGDDWVDSDAFVSYVQKLEDIDSDCILTPFNQVNIGTHTSEVHYYQGVIYGQQYSFDEIINKMHGYFSIHTVTFKTEVLKKIPPISEHCFYVDEEYVCYSVPYLESVTFFSEVVYQYRFGNPSQSVSWQNKIKNRNMHRHVVNEILRYYRSVEASEPKKQFLRRKCARLIGNQIRTYIAMPICKSTRNEIDSFLGETVKDDPALYAEVPGRANKLYRLSGGRLYVLDAFVWRLKKHD